MSRNLKPHGTAAAAKRHQRAGEPMCDPCREAWSRRRVDQLSRHAEPSQPTAPPASPSAAPRLSELEEVRENLVLVIRAMESAPASAIAPLSRRREELDTRLRRLEDEAAREAALTGQVATNETFDALMKSAGITL